MLNFIKVIYRFVSSLGFGIFMLTLMAVVLALATGYEAGAGAQAVQMKVYQSRWFDLLIWLFIASLTLATWRLRPYRLHHLGVIVTHFSILLIAFGALVTRHVGYEGRLRLVEGETSDRLPAEGFALSLSRGGELLESIPVRLGNGQGDLQLREEIQFSDGGTVQLHQYLAAAAVRDTVRAAENGTSAYKLRLSGSDFDLNHWLLTGDERLARLTFGNNLQLQALPPQSTTQWQEAVEQWSETMTGASLTLDFPELGLHQTLNLAGSDTVFDITGSSLQLVIIQQFANFSLDAGNQARDLPGEARNPAISFEIRGADATDRYTYFLKMPGFDPLHGRQPQHPRAEITWQPGNSGTQLLLAGSSVGNGYLFAVARDGEVYQERDVNSITLQPSGEQVEVTEFLVSAVAGTIVRQAGHGRGRAALRFSWNNAGNSVENEWLLFGHQTSFAKSSGDATVDPALQLGFERLSHPLGFQVRLLDFLEEKYPGSRQAASYSSQVKIYDAAAGSTFTALIAMNQPLKYRGHKFFQSSFERIDGDEASIFSVNHDPGTPLVYAGSILLSIGMMMIYYLRRRLIRIERARAARQGQDL